jgi:acyl-CoA dehydrogenase
MAVPIAITVEGANILTRTLITFGQGLLRSHPNLFSIVKSLEGAGDSDGFADQTVRLLKHFASNAASSISRAAFRPRSKHPDLAHYYQGQLSRLSANFAVASDLSLSLGGRLKFEEMLSGRFADTLGTIYLGYACLWWYQQNRHADGIDSVFELAMDSLLYENQMALQGIASNFPIVEMRGFFNVLFFPFGHSYSLPNDVLKQRVSSLITKPSGVRNLLTDGVFLSSDGSDKFRRLSLIIGDAVRADELVARAKKDKRNLNDDEKRFIERVAMETNELIQVDYFDKLGKELFEDDSYLRPALKTSKFADFELSKNLKRDSIYSSKQSFG